MSTPQQGSFVANFTLTALRVVAAFIFIASGTTKIFAFPAALPDGMVLEPMSQLWIGGWLEIVGGALIGIGFLTRPVAFLMSGMMAVAYFQFHGKTDWLWPIKNQGTAAVLFCFIWLYFAAVGAGPWSVDGVRGGRR